MIDRNLPYYKWFWQDWRANRKVQRMSYVERGLYRELLDECWVEGSIPNDIAELADICGCPEDVMADAWQVLESCFELLEDGTLINEKLHSLRTAKDAERAQKSLNGKKGGIAKNFKIHEDMASVKQVPSKCHIEEKRREEKIREEKIKTMPTPEGVSDTVFSDFQKLRKGLKAPVTQTAINALAREGQKAGMSLEQVMTICCQNGWRGFKADWVKDKVPNRTQSDKTRDVLSGLTRGLIGANNDVKLL